MDDRAEFLKGRCEVKYWLNDGSVEPEISGMAICEPCADAHDTDDDPHPRRVPGWNLQQAPGAACCVCGRRQSSTNG